MRKLNVFLFFGLFCTILNFSTAQSLEFKTSKSNSSFEDDLGNFFFDFEIFEIVKRENLKKIKSLDFDYTMNFKFGNSYEWEFELYPADMFADDAYIRVLTEDGEMFHPVPRNISFKGNVKGNPQQQVSLLIHDDYIYAHITEGDQRTYIVSANRYVKDASQNQYLIFDRLDQKGATTGACGLEAYPQFDLGDGHDHKVSGSQRSLTNLCYDVELGIVSDYSLFTDKGSTIQGVINHVVGVMMDVETDYETADFNDALEFEIVEQVISTCNFCEEWTASTSANDLLNDYTTWINNGGFNNSVDMAQLWTNRDFDGATVGLAWNGAGLLCAQAYHILQDFTTDADQLRVMTSHEIGHNLNAVHDAGSGDIMAPSVSNTTTWSTTSVTTIDGTVDAAATASCIAACAATPCDPVTNVSITSVTATGFNISWTATTESLYRLRVRDEENSSIIYTGTPSSSASMTINPAGWEICHQYMVIVENDCGSSVYSAPVSSITAYTALGCAEFTANEVLGWGTLAVTFTDQSEGATSWSWNFGDSGTSTSPSPSHTYTAPGIYTVSLTVNGVHTNTKTAYIYVLPSGEALPYTAAAGGNMNGDDFGTKSLTAGKTSLFEKGIPSGNYFSNATNCWVTDLDADITAQSNIMALYSPVFDFSTVSAATLSFDLGMEVTYANGPHALQVQYSINGGTVWTTLGDDTDPSWYNRGPSSTDQVETQIFADQLGWTFNSNSGTNVSYVVDALAGQSSVIFRFYFGIMTGFPSNGYTRDGVMIDNVAISATSLPVDLTTFTGKRKNNIVELEWQTASETNNDYFLLEKSNDGRNFEEFMTIEGHGNSLSVQDYNCLDEEPFLGINYYRLTQVDFDGTYEVFNELVSVDFTGEHEIAIQPNPTKGDEVKLIYQTEDEGALEAILYNVAGQPIASFNKDTRKGRNVFDISLEGLSNGIYFIQVNQGYIRQTIRFVKTK